MMVKELVSDGYSIPLVAFNNGQSAVGFASCSLMVMATILVVKIDGRY